MRWAGHKAKKKWGEEAKCVQNFGRKDLKEKDQLECLGEKGGLYRNDSCINIFGDFGLELYGSGRDRSCVLVDQVKKRKLLIF
jgi:hypothetical protein